MKKDFWSNARVAVLGGGSFGTVLANLAAKNCSQVMMYVRQEDQVRVMNSTRMNPNYVKDLVLDAKIRAVSEYSKLFETPLDLIISALPSSATRAQAKIMAPFLKAMKLFCMRPKELKKPV